MPASGPMGSTWVPGWRMRKRCSYLSWSILNGVRVHTDASKNLRRRDNALYLVFKIVERLRGNWRGPNGGANLKVLVLAGCDFKEGALHRQEVHHLATAAN